LPPVSIDRSFKKRLAKKPVALQGAILECITRLREDPLHPGLKTKKMGGTDNVFEARVDQANRVTFHWAGDTIVMRNHCNHDMLKRSP
jgi:hypothetical protein